MRGVMVGLGLLLAVLGWCQPRLRLETGIGLTSGVDRAVFSPDGKSILTASVDRTARLWDVKSGREIQRFEGHASAVGSAVFSPDGKSVLTASDDDTARLWDVATGKQLRKFEGHQDVVTAVALSPDGKCVLTASEDKSARLWDVATGKQIWRFDGHGTSVNSVVFSKTGMRALTTGDDKTARLLDVATGREIRRFGGHAGAVNDAIFSPSGTCALTASVDRTARLWDVATGKETMRFEGHNGAVNDAVFSPDGRFVLSASWDKTARIWDAATGKELRRFGGNAHVIMSAAFSPQGNSILTVSGDIGASLCDSETGVKICKIEGHGDSALSASFSPDGSSLLTANVGGMVRLWDTSVGIGNRRLEGHGAFVHSATFSHDGMSALTASEDGTVRLWNVATGKESKRFEVPGGAVKAVMSPDGSTVLTANADGTACLWDVASCQTSRRFEGHASPVVMAQYSPDCRNVLTASLDETARLWDVSTGKESQRFEGHGGYVYTAVFSSNGKTVLTASGDGTARLWDVSTGKESQRFEGHGGYVYTAVFSSNGKTVLTASGDGTARLWDVSTGKQCQQFKGHALPVVMAEFCPDNTCVLTASADGTTRLWDTASGKELCALISFKDGSWAVVDPDGRYDSSDGGQNPNLYWVYEDAAKGILDTIGVDQIGSYFYTPGLLAKVMKREKLPPVEKLDTLPIFPRVDDVKVIRLAGSSLPPGREEGLGMEGDEGFPIPGSAPSTPFPLLPMGGGEHTAVQFTLTDRGGGIGEVKAFVGGQLVKTVQGKPGKNTVDVGEASGDVQIVAYNRTNTLASPRSTGTVPPPGAPSTPTRYVAVIAGIETYAGPGIKPLSYAADDAVAIARSVLACAQGLKITPEIYVLSSAPEAQALKKEGVTVLPGTKAQFKEVFTKILPAGGKWRDSDLMFLYLSGHGTTYKEGNLSHYAYYTEDARDADLGLKRDAWAVTDVELVQWLAAFPGGKRAMVLDTCAAGAATELLAQAKDDADRERAMLDTNRNTGMSVLFGSADTAASWEANGHGLLTYSILQALATQQDLGEDLKDAIRVDTLFTRVEADTRKEAERLGLKQEPRKFGRGQNFPIGFLDEAGRKAIPYASPVPVFATPRLLDSATFADDLKLSEAIGAALSDLGKKGEGPSPIRYVPTSTAGVLIQGGYTVAGDKVTLKLNLTPPGKPRIDLPAIEGTMAEVVAKAAAAIADWARANPPGR